MALFIVLFLSAMPAFAQNELSKIWTKAEGLKSLNDRATHFSEALLNRSYVSDPLGEGAEASFDRDPLFRLDAFDCTTYIESVMALSLSKSEKDFALWMNKIRYLNAKVDFSARNHFAELDWMPNNIKGGWIVDSTQDIGGTRVQTAKGLIDKKAWYQAMDSAELKNLGKNFVPTEVSLSYIPLEAFIKSSADSYAGNEALLSKIPSGTFFNLLRQSPGKRVGEATSLLVRHQGVFVRKGQGLYVRHASKWHKRVVDTPVLDFILAHLMNHKVMNGPKEGLNLFHLMPVTLL